MSRTLIIGILLALMLLTGGIIICCAPPPPPPPPPPTVNPDFVSSIQHCDGTFRAQVDVTQDDLGIRETYDITLGGLANIETGPAADLTVIALSDGDTERVVVSGKLTVPCSPGSLNLTATGRTALRQGIAAIAVAAVPIEVTAPATEDGTPKFTFNATLTCCPAAEDAVRTFNVTLSGAATTNLMATPTSVDCPASGPHTVGISGHLSDPVVPGTVITQIMGHECTLITGINPPS